MNPVEPSHEELREGWVRVIHGGESVEQPFFRPLPSLVQMEDVTSEGKVIGQAAMRAVTEWEPEDDEIQRLEQEIQRWRSGAGPKPRISIMTILGGELIQPMLVVCGQFANPYGQSETEEAHSDAAGPVG